jgi:hypothetical protein
MLRLHILWCAQIKRLMEDVDGRPAGTITIYSLAAASASVASGVQVVLVVLEARFFSLRACLHARTAAFLLMASSVAIGVQRPCFMAFSNSSRSVPVFVSVPSSVICVSIHSMWLRAVTLPWPSMPWPATSRICLLVAHLPCSRWPPNSSRQ